ncbi:MAG: hypothetical protein WAX77_04940 [Methylococcaceae bacterium]
MNNDAQRFLQLLQLVAKEALHLQQVEQRFFEGQANIDLAWLKEKLNTNEGIDQLESFTAKFARLQDTLGDKTLPLFLKLAAEPVGTAIENLNRAEQLNLIANVGQWLSARQLRNLLVHDYIDDLTILVEALQQAKIMSLILIDTANKIKEYAEKISINPTINNSIQ